MITLAIMAKLFTVGGFIFPAGIITFPLCAILSDLMTEIYGFNRTRQAIWTVFACTVLFVGFTQIAILLPSASFWPHQGAFELVFASAPRIAIAGCLAWMAGEFSNSFVMSRLKIAQNAKGMPVRFIGSTAIGQGMDSIVFMVVAFAGTMPISEMIVLILSAWGFKVLYEIFALPLSVPVTNWVKRREGIEHFDKQKISIV